jgi:hypothetical protein
MRPRARARRARPPPPPPPPRARGGHLSSSDLSHCCASGDWIEHAIACCLLSEPARGFSVLATGGYQYPPVNFQAGMQQPGILQPAEADSQSIGRRRFTEQAAFSSGWNSACWLAQPKPIRAHDRSAAGSGR